MPATSTGRGAQVVLEGYARTLARGGAGRSQNDNMKAMAALVSSGLVADGNAADGTSRNGGKAYDPVVAQFPREPLAAWEVPSPQLGAPTLLTVPQLNISNIPLANPDGSPPAGAVKGDLYNNGGFVCIAP